MLRTSEAEGLSGTVCVLGFFDGVHLGHRALLERAIGDARQQGGMAAAVTFRQHPLSVLAPDRLPPLLSTADERAACMERMGMDALVELDFTAQLAQMEPEAFIARLVRRCAVRKLIVGFNYSFGRGGRGGGALLRQLAGELGFDLEILEPVQIMGQPVSSSRIREALQAGDTLLAAQLLGRAYSLEGEILRGKQLGRTLGFPTLNIDYPGEKVLPSAGVYAGWIHTGEGLVPAVTNIGTNPTVERGPRIRLESHALAPIHLGYGDRARVLFGGKLRPEQRFSSVEALTAQVTEDKARALRWIADQRENGPFFGDICP